MKHDWSKLTDGWSRTACGIRKEFGARVLFRYDDGTFSIGGSVARSEINTWLDEAETQLKQCEVDDREERALAVLRERWHMAVIEIGFVKYKPNSNGIAPVSADDAECLARAYRILEGKEPPEKLPPRKVVLEDDTDTATGPDKTNAARAVEYLRGNGWNNSALFNGCVMVSRASALDDAIIREDWTQQARLELIHAQKILRGEA